MDLPLAEQTLAAAGARTMLSLLEQLLEHEASLRAGEAAEPVHRARVATRRLRAAARLFRGAIAAWGGAEALDQARDALRALAASLAPVREQDVLIGALRAEAAAHPDDAPAIERLVGDHLAERRAALGPLVAALDGPALAYLRGPFRAALAEIGAPGGPPRERVRRRAPDLIVDRLTRLRRRGRRLRFPTDDQLHRLRIAAKRLRYTAELFRPAFPGVEATIALATELQDLLGGLRDDEIAVDVLLRDLERVDADTRRAGDGAAIARLVARRRARRHDLLARLQIAWRRVPSASELRDQLQGASK